MIINLTVTTSWNMSNKPHYEKLGYHFIKFGDPLIVNVIDLPVKSKVRVTVRCDGCHKEWETRYSNVSNLCRRCKQLERRQDIWKTEDLEILQQYRTAEDPASLLGKFSVERTANAIAIKARREGIKRAKKKQTPENPFHFSGSVTSIEAMLFGYHLGDGWLSQIKQGKGFTYGCGFGGDTEGLTNIKEDIKKQFGLELPPITHRKTDSIKYGIKGTTNALHVPITIAKHLLLMGVPIGKKVEVPFCLPDWLIKGELLLKLKFLSGLYCAEGDTLSFQTNGVTVRAPALRITKRKVHSANFEILLEQIGQLLDDVGIGYSLKKTLTETCAENIQAEFVTANSNESIVRFCQMIDFRYSPRKGLAASKSIQAYCLLKLLVGNSATKAEKSLWAVKQLNKIDKEIATLVSGLAESYRDKKFMRTLPPDFPRYREFLLMVNMATENLE